MSHKSLQAPSDALVPIRQRSKCTPTQEEQEDLAKLRQEVRDGRKCTLGGEPDHSPDDVFPLEYLYWAYPPKGSPPKPQGDLCWYCRKVYVNRFAIAYTSVDLLAEAMAKDPEGTLLSEFKAIRKWVGEFLKQAGSRAGPIRWKRSGDADDRSPPAVLSFNETSTLTVEEPDDLIVLLSDYKFGDPATNGKGHRSITHFGMPAVLMPGERVWRVKRAHTKSTSIQKVLDDGSETVCADQAQSKQQDLEAQIWGHRAVGQSMSICDLFGGPSSTAASEAPRAGSSSSAMDPATTTKSGSRSTTGATSNDCFQFDFLAPPPVTPLPLAQASVRPTTQRRPKGKKPQHEETGEQMIWTPKNKEEPPL